MTKAELVSIIAKRTGVERQVVLTTVEAFMEEVKISLEKGENVHLRGFGSFVVKHRAQKTGRILARNTTISYRRTMCRRSNLPTRSSIR